MRDMHAYYERLRAGGGIARPDRGVRRLWRTVLKQAEAAGQLHTRKDTSGHEP